MYCGAAVASRIKQQDWRVCHSAAARQCSSDPGCAMAYPSACATLTYLTYLPRAGRSERTAVARQTQVHGDKRIIRMWCDVSITVEACHRAAAVSGSAAVCHTTNAAVNNHPVAASVGSGCSVASSAGKCASSSACKPSCAAVTCSEWRARSQPARRLCCSSDCSVTRVSVSSNTSAAVNSCGRPSVGCHEHARSNGAWRSESGATPVT